MQPTYLPWSGYFNLILRSDCFVFLDDAQYQKSSWHNRNRILLNGQAHWITVPVRKISLAQTINETPVDDSKPWRRKHVNQLKQVYGKHPFAADALEVCELIENDSSASLAELNIKIVTWLANKLGITTRTVRSSELGITGKRTERLVQILTELNASEYLSPPGATDYLQEDGFETRTPIRLTIQGFEPQPYAQKSQTEFISHLSVIDVIANTGWQGAIEYIR